jgi:hypothetical protein
MARTARDKRRQRADAEDSSSCVWRRVEAEAEAEETNVSMSAKGSTLTQTIKATKPAPKTPQL